MEETAPWKAGGQGAEGCVMGEARLTHGDSRLTHGEPPPLLPASHPSVFQMPKILGSVFTTLYSSFSRSGDSAMSTYHLHY